MAQAVIMACFFLVLYFFSSSLHNITYISGRRSITFGQRVHMGLKSCRVMQI